MCLTSWNEFKRDNWHNNNVSVYPLSSISFNKAIIIFSFFISFRSNYFCLRWSSRTLPPSSFCLVQCKAEPTISVLKYSFYRERGGGMQEELSGYLLWVKGFPNTILSFRLALISHAFCAAYATPIFLLERLTKQTRKQIYFK